MDEMAAMAGPFVDGSATFQAGVFVPVRRRLVVAGPEIRLNSVMINVVDIDTQATFWSELLGVEVGMATPDFVWLRKQGGVGVALQRVDDPAAVPGRVHIDTLVDDLDAATAHAGGLGAVEVARHDLGGLAWVVMTDPEGNEFCLVEQSS